jgi:hypothetical protein
LDGGALKMDQEGILFLLAMGPASAVGLYWMLYRYYRNTDKSHSFEHETQVVTRALTGAEADHRINAIRGTQQTRIPGDNVGRYRHRVKRF